MIQLVTGRYFHSEIKMLLKWMRRRIGRRGATLLFLGLLNVSTGLNLLSSTNAQVTAFTRILPLSMWAALWLSSGIIALIQAFTYNDRLAFTFAAGMMSVWGLTYVTAWALNLIDRGWLGGIIYIALAGWILILSSWPEAFKIIVPRSVTENFPESLIIADERGNITGWNRAAEKMFGWTESEIIGRPLTVIMPNRYRPSHAKALAKVSKTGISRLAGQVITANGLRRDGTEFPIEIRIGAYQAGNVMTYSTIIINKEKSSDDGRSD